MQVNPKNPLFLDEAGAYLEANGFMQAEGMHTSFFKNDKAIIITGDSIEFHGLADDDPDQQAARMILLHRFTGISCMSVFEYMLLFHITGMVPLKEFIRNVKKSIPFEAPLLNFLMTFPISKTVTL